MTTLFSTFTSGSQRGGRRGDLYGGDVLGPGQSHHEAVNAQRDARTAGHSVDCVEECSVYGMGPPPRLAACIVCVLDAPAKLCGGLSLREGVRKLQAFQVHLESVGHRADGPRKGGLPSGVAPDNGG